MRQRYCQHCQFPIPIEAEKCPACSCTQNATDTAEKLPFLQRPLNELVKDERIQPVLNVAKTAALGLFRLLTSGPGPCPYCGITIERRAMGDRCPHCTSWL